MQVFNAGVDHPVFASILERGVRLTNSSGTASTPIAQTAIAGMLHLTRELAGRLRDLGDELHRARRRTDHGNPFAGEVVGGGPTCRVEDGPLKGVEPLDVGHRQIVEHADGADHDVGLELVGPVHDELPDRAFLVPLR